MGMLVPQKGPNVILKFLVIFEQRDPHFHVVLGAHTHYVAGPASGEGKLCHIRNSGGTQAVLPGDRKLRWGHCNYFQMSKDIHAGKE